MEWHVTDAQSLATIDREIGGAFALMYPERDALSPASPREYRHFSLAEYEIIRRVIYATGDFEYKTLIEFSERSLQAAAAALASRSSIVVDTTTVQAGIIKNVQNSFANPVYCAMEAQTRPQKQKTVAAWGMEALAKRYPEGIFVVGQDPTALKTLVELIEAEKIRPVLIIATPPKFMHMDIDAKKQTLTELSIPNITIKNQKGGAIVAAAILDGLIDLAWEAYG
ncbi:precorrin-8X methylmutase [Rivularia sp. UHCC 0363]|uniref:precorrin-8X methylmutase n=1 Tax=Rivularia sp. UHCC 0363 TaxID=3110244 RepID=UPI002B210EE5|nr:precorrin-8X methylmutase [Rivularia sp. UHCC 0363]MEA5597205.1 precorrin-8X methylmutase [Rivularia sp. UHCC 0363]